MVGREAARLAAAAGFTIVSVEPVAVALLDLGAGEHILGLRRYAARAVRAGHLTEDSARRWLGALSNGPFLAYVTMVTPLARA